MPTSYVTHYKTTGEAFFVACGRRTDAVNSATLDYRRVDCQACRNEVDRQADGGSQLGQESEG